MDTWQPPALNREATAVPRLRLGGSRDRLVGCEAGDKDREDRKAKEWALGLSFGFAPVDRHQGTTEEFAVVLREDAL